MSKLVRILSVILIAFALSSLVVYRLRLSSTLRRSRQHQSASGLVEETRIIEGEIQTVDPGSRTFTLVNEGEEVMLAFDERTSILESGRPVQPASITSGTSAAENDGPTTLPVAGAPDSVEPSEPPSVI